MSLSHRKQPDHSDRFDGEIGGIRFMVVFGADGKVVRGKRSEVPTPAMPTKAPPVEPKLTPWQLLTAPLKLLKAHVGIDAVDDATYAYRRGKCEGTASTPKCENYDFGVCGGEKGCGCYLAAKIRLKGEKCPIEKW